MRAPAQKSISSKGLCVMCVVDEEEGCTDSHPATHSCAEQGLSRYLETGCPKRGFMDFCVSKVWYKIHTTNKIDPTPLQILLF